MNEEIIVQVKQGKLRGKIAQYRHNGDYYCFQGIPCAKAPLGLGDLRFKAPQPPEVWNGVRDATKEGSESVSLNKFNFNVVGSEDCLFLNVYTPTLSSQSKKLKPVMVWIHGGFFVFGSGNSEFYGPDFLIPPINYRLGLLGFLNFDDPSLGIPGNASLKDQVMALKWVQKNIACFNGDPNNVTIFGQSAGRIFVHCLILSPLASASAQKVIGHVIENPSAELPFLSEYPIDLIKSGRYNQILMLFGYCNKEGLSHEVVKLLGYGEMEITDDFETAIPDNLQVKKGSELSKEIARKIKEFYYGEEEPSRKNMESYYKEILQSDNQCIKTIYDSIRLHSKTCSKPVYLYRVSLESKLNFCKHNFKIELPGVAHCDEINYLFKNKTTPLIRPESIEDEGIYKFTQLWTNFAYTEDPNPPKKDFIINLAWLPVEKELVNFLEIGKNLTVGVNPEYSR